MGQDIDAVRGEITPEQQRRLRRMRSFSHLLDEWIRIPGTSYRIGLDGLIGLIPGVGDVAGALLSAYILREAYKLDVPIPTLIRMAGNIGLEAIIGTIPLVGDVFDFAWKANKRNLALVNARHRL